MKHVIVGIDGGEGSKRAAKKAAELVEAIGGRLHFVTVVERSATKVVGEGSERWFINSVEEAGQMVRQFVGASTFKVEYEVHTVTGDPAAGLLAKATEVGADLIVVGNHRMQGLSRILGSVGADVLNHAPCDVYIAKTTG